MHHHLIREKTRTQVGLVIETGEAREVHHMACCSDTARGAINPYLAFETIEDMIAQRRAHRRRLRHASKNYIKAAGKGVLKVMSKMGISTVASYTGAQVFEAIGLGHELVDEYFTGTVAGSAGSASTSSPRRCAVDTRMAYPDRPEEPPTATSSSAASTSGAARARTTSSTRRPCSSSSTRPARGGTTSSRSTRSWSTTRPRRSATLRGLFELAQGAERLGPLVEPSVYSLKIEYSARAGGVLELEHRLRGLKRWTSPSRRHWYSPPSGTVAVRELLGARRVGVGVAAPGRLGHLVETDAAGAADGAGEVLVDELVAEADRLEDLRGRCRTPPSRCPSSTSPSARPCRRP